MHVVLHYVTPSHLLLYVMPEVDRGCALRARSPEVKSSNCSCTLGQEPSAREGRRDREGGDGGKGREGGGIKDQPQYLWGSYIATCNVCRETAS